MSTQIDGDILRALADQAHKMDVYPDARFPPSPYYRFLRILARSMSPAVCVELGVCGGGASLHMALSDEENGVIGVDCSNDYPEQLKFIEGLCPNFQFWQMDSIDAVLDAAVHTWSYPVDLLFIDTIHTEERTMAEFDAWRPLLSDRAVVVLDDLYRDGMINAWNRIPGNKLRLDLLHIGGSPTDGGFGVIWNPEGWN